MEHKHDTNQVSPMYRSISIFQLEQ